MSVDYVTTPKKADDSKNNGISIAQRRVITGTQQQARMQRDVARFDKILADIEAKIYKLAPYAEAERQDRVKHMGGNMQRMREKSKAKSKFLLMDLPGELRITILNFAIESISTAVFLKGRNGSKPTQIPLPPIVRTRDKRLPLEALMVTIEKTTLEIHSGPANTAMQGWLGHIDFTKLEGDTSYKTGFDAVKAIHFPYFSRFPHKKLDNSTPNNDIVMMTTCKHLRKLSIVFVDEELTDRCNDVVQAKSIDQLRREYRLDHMLMLKELKHLDIQSRTTRFVYEDAGTIGDKQVKALGEWFEEEYGKRGVTVQISSGGYLCKHD